MLGDEKSFRAKIVQLILMKDTEKAIETLSEHYGVGVPHLKVGLPKKFSRKVGVYVSQTKTIHVMNSERLEDPFVILHEFYHHLRTQDKMHGGTEKHANRFAEEFIKAYYTNFQKYSFQFSYKYDNSDR